MARALTATWQHLMAAHPGWSRRERGALAVATMVPVPSLNGVFVDELDADPDMVAELLDEVAAFEVPHCLQLRPGCSAALNDLAARRRMTREADVPLMMVETQRSMTFADRHPAGLVIQTLSSGRADLHASLAAAAFEAPEEYFRRLVTPAVLSAAGVVCYGGEVDGEPVTTGVGVTLGDFVGVFNIATPAAHCRRGYGAAVTARVVRDGSEHGAQRAWLQSSPAGFHVYQRLGFRTVESWRFWLASA